MTGETEVEPTPETDGFAALDADEFVIAKGIEPEEAPWGCDYCIGHATYYLMARGIGTAFRCDDHLPPALADWPERRGAALDGTTTDAGGSTDE